MSLGVSLVGIFFSLYVIVLGGNILVLDNVLSKEQCDTLISRQPPDEYTTRVSVQAEWREWDNTLFHLFSSTAANYFDQYARMGVAYPDAERDIGYTLLKLDKNNKTLALIVDPKEAVFGVMLFLSDEVAGGELLFKRSSGKDKQIKPDCGRVVVFPASNYAFPKMINKIRTGYLYFVLTYFKK